MIASALLIPAATSALSSVASSLLTPQSAQVPSGAVTSNKANVERDTRAQPRMQSLQLTNLGQTLLKGTGALFPTAMNIGEENKEKAKGGAIMVGGAAIEGVGKRLGTSGGLGTKVVGAGLVWGGRVVQEIGKDIYDRSGEKGNNHRFDSKNFSSRLA
ncbi:hypothetical protein [Pseudomonas trivialis]|uniref:Uncharacterized protein n=1 Tax=Pseudomonas trivialis TaxID=200450 RepID=A0A0H5A5E8_9PSED|nr:hypothetical protein [Pseudomonas trivialis]AKS06259.1 hypothetical protein AA957_09110 [Pseudomonas trivialis]